MRFLLLCLLGIFIGWFTNYLAIRMLFRPRIPRRLPGTPWVVQGLIPRRRHDIVAAIADTVSREILPAEYVLERITAPRVRQIVADRVVEGVARRVEGVMPPFVPRPVTETVKRLLADASRRELDRFFTTALPALLVDMQGEFDVAAAARERLEAVSLDDLEAMILRISRNELRYIEILGGMIGGLIGLLEAVLTV